MKAIFQTNCCRFHSRLKSNATFSLSQLVYMSPYIRIHKEHEEEEEAALAKSLEGKTGG